MVMELTLSPLPLLNASITWTTTPTPARSLGAMALAHPSSEETDPVFISPSVADCSAKGSGRPCLKGAEQ